MSASQLSSRKHDSLTGATSERESQVWEGAADSSIIEQEPSVAAGPVSSRTADDSFPVPSLPHIGQLWDVVVFVLVCVDFFLLYVGLLVSCGTVLVCMGQRVCVGLWDMVVFVLVCWSVVGQHCVCVCWSVVG